MPGALLHRLLMALGRKQATPLREAAAPAEDDFVARHGLSYAEAADPISKEAHLEIERLKSVKPPRK
jgi:hypothetical protein